MTPRPTPPRPQPPAAPPAPSQVRLEVRVGGAPAAGYELAGDECVVGGGAGADLRLPGAHLPNVVCRIGQSADGLWLRQVDPAFPVLHNGEPVAGTGPALLRHGDRLAVGPADITVSLLGTHIRPTFVPVTSNVNVPAPRPATEDRAELLRLRTELEEQARELEADRVLWYRRRQEIEDECRRLRDAATQPVAAREAELRQRESALAGHEQELNRFRDELSGLRENLLTQYRDRRDQLARDQEAAQAAAEELAEQRRQFEADAEKRRQELDARERSIDERVKEATSARLAELEADFARRRDELTTTPPETEALRTELAQREEELRRDRDQHAADLVRLDRWQGSLDARQRDLDRRAAEVDERYDQLTRDTVELEEQVRLAGAEQERIAAESARLDKLRAALEAEAAKLAERSAQVESQQAMLAVLRASLDRQRDDARREAAQLAADRARLDRAQSDLDDRLREAERLRAELTVEREGQAEQQKLIAERTALLDATLHEIQQQKDSLAAEHARQQAKEADLDVRSAEIAEQTAILKARATQVMELQERLEADRAAVRTREATLTDADTARQTFQEQLRRRAEELAARSKHLDDAARRLADEKSALEGLRTSITAEQQDAERGLSERITELDRRAQELADRETTLERRVGRLREAGQTVATARKELAEARKQWDAVRTAAAAAEQTAREEFVTLTRAVPDLEDQAKATLDRLSAARDVLRGHLGELHTFAGTTREELDRVRAELREDSDRLRAREQALEKARDEHRLAVAEFRQQLVEWQGRVAELKQTMARSESRLDARQAEVNAAAQQVVVTHEDLARQAEELRRERERVAERRTEVERHLADMREWYRKKLRELAAQRADTEPDAIAGRVGMDARDDLEPGDKQLGELLRSADLVDADTLAALWGEAQRQRRTLRQVLLASGAVTLYQLAIIEAGNLDALMLGRLRVLDRLRVTGREVVYRVFDPTRADGPTRGVHVLRHLAESETEDAVRPDEFRQRFAAARDAAHPHLAATLEVLEIQGRPAVLQEWVNGVPSADWPADAAAPGVWVRLLRDAATALDAAHRGGLVHGRLTSDSLVLTADGGLKVTGFGDPPWLAAGAPVFDPTADADLRALGQVAFGWAQLGQTAAGKKRGRSKGFPESLTAVVRRLESDAEPPMGDTAGGPVPYRSAAELAADLDRLAKLFPCPPDAWDRLVRHVTDAPAGDTEQAA